MEKERAKEILIKYKKQTDLFNWCDEYESFMDKNVCCLVNEEAEFMLKQSLENSDSPLSYDDIDLYYYEFDEIQTDLEQEFIDDGGRTDEEIKELKAKLKVLIKEEDIDDLESFATDNLLSFERSDYERTREIMQWFIVTGDLAHHIKEEDGIILNENWFGRE